MSKSVVKHGCEYLYCVNFFQMKRKTWKSSVKLWTISAPPGFSPFFRFFQLFCFASVLRHNSKIKTLLRKILTPNLNRTFQSTLSLLVRPCIFWSASAKIRVSHFERADFSKSCSQFKKKKHVDDNSKCGRAIYFWELCSTPKRRGDSAIACVF